MKWAKLMPGKVNKVCFKHIYSTFQSMSVQTHQGLILVDFNFTKDWKHPDRPPLTAFACSTVSQLRVKTRLVRTDHIWVVISILTVLNGLGCLCTSSVCVIWVVISILPLIAFYMAIINLYLECSASRSLSSLRRPFTVQLSLLWKSYTRHQTFLNSKCEQMSSWSSWCWQ